jgi:hypothetical protein
MELFLVDLKLMLFFVFMFVANMIWLVIRLDR